MLSIMRKKAGSWMIKVILGIIVIVFVFWGVGSFRESQVEKIASINDIPISFEEYRKAYDSLIDQFRRSFGNNLTDEMVKSLQLRRRALDQVMERKLLLSEVSRLNFIVTDEELVEAIREFPAFQQDGVFNARLYNNLLAQNRLSPEEFEQSQREAMLIEKLRGLISDRVKLSDREIREWYDWENATVNIEYMIIDPERFQGMETSNDEIANYFDKHKESYKTQPRRKIGYLLFAPQDYTDQVSVTDTEIKDYYEANPESFETAKTVEARHILIRVDQDAGEETAAAAKQKALDIHKMATDGHDFGELAKEYSEGPSKDQGGKLGAFRKEDMVAPFSEKAFSMKSGEISQPVRTRFGWHLIKVEKINEASTRSLAEATPEIRKKLTEDRARTLAYDAADTVYEESFDGEDLLKVAQSRELAFRETDYVARTDQLKEVRDHRKFIAAAFNLADKEISEVQELSDGYYILQVTDKKPEMIPDLKDVEVEVRDDLIEEKKDLKAGETAAALTAEMVEGASMADVGKPLELTPKTTGHFKRDDPIPEIGNEPEVAQAAFKLTPQNPIGEPAVKGAMGYHIIRLMERKKPADDGFDAQKKDIEKRLLQMKRSKAFETYLTQLKANAREWVMEGFLN